MQGPRVKHSLEQKLALREAIDERLAKAVANSGPLMRHGCDITLGIGPRKRLVKRVAGIEPA